MGWAIGVGDGDKGMEGAAEGMEGTVGGMQGTVGEGTGRGMGEGDGGLEGTGCVRGDSPVLLARIVRSTGIYK